MLKIFKGLFQEMDSELDSEKHLHLASAILLYEVLKADHEIKSEEEQQLQNILRDRWNLGENSLNDLCRIASDQSKLSVSLHDKLDVINENFNQQEKYQLLRGLWMVALADDEIHHYEEHLIRRLADMMHLSHSQFIQAKCEVLDKLKAV